MASTPAQACFTANLDVHLDKARLLPAPYIISACSSCISRICCIVQRQDRSHSRLCRAPLTSLLHQNRSFSSSSSQASLPEQSSLIGRGSFPTPFRRTSNQHSSDSDSSHMLEGKRSFACARDSRKKKTGRISGLTWLFLLPSFFSALFFFSAFLFCIVWRPHCARSFLLRVPRRGERRQVDAPLDPFSSFASFLSSTEACHAWQHATLAPPGQQFIFILQDSMPGKRQFVTFLLSKQFAS